MCEAWLFELSAVVQSNTVSESQKKVTFKTCFIPNMTWWLLTGVHRSNFEMFNLEVAHQLYFSAQKEETLPD